MFNIRFGRFSDKGLDTLDFSTAVPPCGITEMDADFTDKLLIAQKMLGEKFRINCGYRSKEWDLSKGRNGLSSHCKGLAVDIHTPNHLYRLWLLVALLFAGFDRIGIAENFIHVDMDSEKVPSLWLYQKGNTNVTF